MSPSREINADFQLSPLKIRDDSNLINPTIFSTNASTTTSLAYSSASQCQPVIIYTQSPKIIHTLPCNFMFVVQKLTGFSTYSNDNDNNPTPPPPDNDDAFTVTKKRKISLRKKKKELVKPSLDDCALQLMPETSNFEFNPMLSDVSLFTRGFTSEFFDFPNSIYKCTDLSGISLRSDINSSSSTFSEI